MPKGETRRLKPIIKNTNKSFNLRQRDPGWMPDMIHSTMPNESDERLFPDEAIGLTNSPASKLIPFQTPKGKNANGAYQDFSDPLPNATAEERNEFNKWILGHPLEKPKTGAQPSDIEFYNYLTDLFMMCRRYNASLYRMRRLHIATHPLFPSDGLVPNPTDLQLKELPDTKDLPIYNKAIKDAEKDWELVTGELRDKLKLSNVKWGDKTVKQVFADMVEVNNYIVSARIIVEFIPEPSTEEYGGGSSSHISISSPYSSMSSR
jgi:hypothetical protein